ncbi:MAG: GntR family transcriptional regulator [Victivallaceae bacterium]|nr:GntR family transcriptional regulator [Victivallaceae bacterium]
MEKYRKIAGLLETRILHGDYLLGELPTENSLAAEVGVSRMTARKALLLLQEKGVIERKDNGRPVCLKNGCSDAEMVLIAPAWVSVEYQSWRYSLEQEVQRNNQTIRIVDYVHWDDPVLIQTLDAFDKVFLLPAGGDLPERVAERMRKHSKLVVLGQDFTSYGLLSINLFPPQHIGGLLNLLKNSGCRTINCLCSQPSDKTIKERISQWQWWLKMHSCSGTLLTDHFPTYSFPIENAYSLVRKHLADYDRPDAFFCVTINGAIGAMRACAEAGLHVGSDILVCAVNGQEINRYLVPSVTCLEGGECRAMIRTVLSWMSENSGAWNGPLLLQPEEPSLFVGESTQGALVVNGHALSQKSEK